MLLRLCLLGVVLLQGLFLQTTEVDITSPQTGSALQGAVRISGSTAIEGFASVELAFQYQESPDGTWFPLQSTSEPVSGGLITVWDTSTLTDGDYRLRLRVFRQDGTFEERQIENLRVRNYLPLETLPAARTTQPAITTPTPVQTSTRAAALAAFTATPLPPNPVEVTNSDLGQSALQGLMMMAALFGLFILFRLIRSWFHSGR